MRTIGIVTVARSDWGILCPIAERLRHDPEMALQVIAGGMHLSPAFGRTIDEITAAGFGVAAQVEMSLSSDAPEAVAKSIGLGVIGFAQVFAQLRPDLVVLVGDRFEMFAAAVAALPLTIPVAHVHGGELTAGAIDDALRHSMTKLSHLHFVSTEEYAARVRQLGEEPWRIVVSGAPALDNLTSFVPYTPAELRERFGVETPPGPYLLVTLHPTTLQHGETSWQVGELLAALDGAGFPVVFTAPNADTGNYTIRTMLAEFVRRQPQAQHVETLGTRAYLTLMRNAAAVVGNSSSGIIEAASFHVPVVNIGSRQAGRVRGANVIDVSHNRDDVLRGIQQATAPGFRVALGGMRNPYGDGHAAERILESLRTIRLDDRMIQKRFVDCREAPSAG